MNYIWYLYNTTHTNWLTYKDSTDFKVTMSECKQLANKYGVTVLSKGFNDIAVGNNSGKFVFIVKYC